MSRRSERVYEWLLRLYPREFRRRYARAMRDFHLDRLVAARGNGESIAGVWARATFDIIRSAAAERFQDIFAGESVVRSITQDVAYAVRGMARRPLFTALVAATIALGVGANAAIFSVVNGILIQPLPYPQAERLFSFGHEPPQWLTSQPDFLDYHDGMRTLDGLAAYTRGDATMSGTGDPERLRLAAGSEDFFRVLGTAPFIGRTFVADEFVPDRSPSVVISYGLFVRRFGGDRRIVGQKIVLNGSARTVIGVMPAHFDFPDVRTDVWLALRRFNPDSLGDRSQHYLFMVGRVKPGISLPGALAEANTIAQRIVRSYPEKFDPKQPLRPHLASVRDQLVGKTQPYLLALLGAAAFVLLIACANVANLLLVRSEGRQKEMAVRSALGASDFRLISQLLTESGVLAALGGLFGLGLAWAVTWTLVRLAPASIPRIDAIGIDWRVVAFTFTVATITGLAIGLVPAWHTRRTDSAETLRDAGRVVSAHGAARGVRRALVATEVALAVVTLSGAGMLLRSLWHLERADLGFDPRGVLTAKVALPPQQYDNARALLFFDQLQAELRRVPGVLAVGLSGWLPVVDAGGLWGFRPEGGDYGPDGRWPLAVPQQVTPGYFAAAGVRLIAGRDITAADRDDGTLVAVVSKAFADQAWRGRSAIGKRFRLAIDSMITVVGVVNDIRSRGFGDTPEPTMYFPLAQSARGAYFMPRSMAILARVSGDPHRLETVLREQVRSLDRTVPVSEVRTLEQIAGTSISNRRFNTTLLGAFAALALLLAGIGTYGVISYGVTQRTFEIGVRIALGAGSQSVIHLVMAEGMALALVGLALGLSASVAVGRSIRAMLVDVPPIDVPSLAATGVLLLVVAALACVFPARRALRVSPVEALRGN